MRIRRELATRCVTEWLALPGCAVGSREGLWLPTPAELQIQKASSRLHVYSPRCAVVQALKESQVPAVSGLRECWMEARVAVRFCLLGLSSLLIGSSASAGGYEFPGDGARALGRGGAFAARADDPMAIVVNPAGLASLPGTQIWVSTHLAFAKDCFTRNQPGVAADGTTPTAPVWPDGWGQDPSGNAISYTQVCDEKNKRFSAVPSIAVTWRISKRIGMGFGVIA